MIKKILNKNKFLYFYAREMRCFMKNYLYIRRNNMENSFLFDYDVFKKEILNYVETNRLPSNFKYKFSKSCVTPDLYSSVYALMIYGLFDEIKKLSEVEKKQWANYINSFQLENGLFVDNAIDTPLAHKIHGWGWYHLIPHLIIALTYIGYKPNHDFKFLYDKFDEISIEEWLETREWHENYLGVSNEIMNVTVMLQYSRDYFNNGLAKGYVKRILEWLKVNKIDQKTGLWGYNTSISKYENSKAVKAAYHFIPMYIYDNDISGINVDSIIKYTLQTQNQFGTYSPYYNADACEDIDSLYLLTQMSSSTYDFYERKKSVEKFFSSIFVNLKDDGGFVFKNGVSFQYADSKLTSLKDESNMFATWFRVLSIAYSCDFLNVENGFRFSDVPGYQYLDKGNA